MTDACPCGAIDARGKPLALAACCGRYLDTGQPAPDAQTLMRSAMSQMNLSENLNLTRAREIDMAQEQVNLMK